DSTADDNFLLRKAMEQFLTKQFEGRFLSQYSMVTFSNIRYSTALKKGDERTVFLQKLVQKYPDESTWKGDSELLAEVDEWLIKHA
ncbi:MAG: hypothetical protein ACPG4Z_07210, partial [Chitinophagales bacterium]